MDRHAVVFTDDHRPDLETFAPELAELLGLSLIDARLRIRKGRGIFLDRLDETTARRVAGALTARGWTAEVVPQASLLRFARPARLFQVDCREDGFHYKRNMAEPFRSVPWDAVRLVHAGVVATPQYRDFVRSKTFQMLPTLARIDDPEARAQLKRAMAKKAMQREADAPDAPPAEGRPLTPEALAGLARDRTDAYVDLFVEGRQGFLRADRGQVILDYLGMRGSGNSLESFKRFAADVTERAAGALVTPLARQLLEGRDLPQLVFDDLAEYERYIAWFCLRNGVAPPAGGKVAVPEDTPPLPAGLDVTACARCGTVVEAGADRCGYCKSPLRSRRRRLFWRIVIPLFLVWGLAVTTGFLYQEVALRREAIDRVRHYTIQLNPDGPTTTVDTAIRESVRGLNNLKPHGWGATRVADGVYHVEFILLRRTYDGSLHPEQIRFRVALDAGEVRPLNPDAARYIPEPGPPAPADPGPADPGAPRVEPSPPTRNP